MTLTDRTAPEQYEALAFELEFPHAPEKVWRAISEPELLAQWLLPTVGYKFERDHAFTFQTDPVGGWDGKVACRIAEIDPPTRLVYAWGVGELATIVTFTLQPTSSGTRLTLVQSGFKESQKKNFGGARYGWRMMSTKLLALVDTLN